MLNEPQWTLPLLFVRAEAAWLSGSLPDLAAELAVQYAATDAREDAWRSSELHHWCMRAGAEIAVAHGSGGWLSTQGTGVLGTEGA